MSRKLKKVRYIWKQYFFHHQPWLKLSIIIFYLFVNFSSRNEMFLLILDVNIKLIDVDRKIYSCNKWCNKKRSCERKCVGKRSIITDYGKFNVFICNRCARGAFCSWNTAMVMMVAINKVDGSWFCLKSFLIDFY